MDGRGEVKQAVLHSMTGYASLSGDDGAVLWDWEIRGVNSKGLDLRMRLPDGGEALEPVIRTSAKAYLSRGGVTVSLRLMRKSSQSASAVDPAGLSAALSALAAIDQEAAQAGLSMAQPTAADILALPGVMRTESGRHPIPQQVADYIRPLFAAFAEMRATEGATLGRVLALQLDAMEKLIAQAKVTAEARTARAGELLRRRVADLLGNAEQADPARLSQELALIAVKADITEELDRLSAHLEAARGLMSKGGVVGRRFEFLLQEFNREANTLCAKSGSTDLTALGLELKVVIDQMREQVQNLE